MTPNARRRPLKGFTLMELLLVVLIFGIMAAAIVPRIGGLLDGGKAAVAARTVAQAGRYARSMALLNQVPMELRISPQTSLVSVVAAPRRSESQSESSAPEGFTEGVVASFGRAVSRDDRIAAAPGLLARTTPTPQVEPETSDEGNLEDELRLDTVLQGVSLRFEGYLDNADFSNQNELSDDVEVIRYRANGTCRPYRLAVIGTRTEERFLVEVDPVGTPKISRDDGRGRASPRRRP
jgi:prepilin-type N-terminal cleavage/methylation domain-containing protein